MLPFILPVAALLAWGCRSPVDRVYALLLEHEPSERDWAAAVPYRTTARGGRVTLPADQGVDADSVHKATASCHHGTPPPEVWVEIRAFYTPSRLYVQVRWPDPTLDSGPGWRWSGAGWRAEAGGQDGAGILWGGEIEGFRCARACHLEDWRVEGPRSFGDYTMAVPEGWPALDLWEWKAGWGGDRGAADDLSLTRQGRRPDAQGVRFVRNATEEGEPLESPPPEPGVAAPAFLDRGGGRGRTEVTARGVWRDGVWTVTFQRALRPFDPEDIAFLPGRRYWFGLALLDGVAEDHNAVAEPVPLYLVEPGEVNSEREGGP